ncbi:MAG: Gfo/Idh/MocA family oxidoreductase [Melioribacteraceae bacterium]|nr:Gfo/Idh/MocA family oxidoreductase [Melioribacteraceae bacterium]
MGNEETKKTEDVYGLTRRSFLTQSGMAAAAFTILPSYMRGDNKKVPSDLLNIAVVGIGGKGASDAQGVSSQNIVALCDIDDTMGMEVRKAYPKATQYRDYRKMLEKEKNLDAVVIATPDHTHAIIAMAAMQMGKHVYVQKPLTHTVYEARRLAEVAKEKKLITQMGNQGHAGEESRLLVEWIQAGAIGDVTEVHIWTNRPIWPQGDIKRPTEIPTSPDSLDWNLFLGPAPFRAYHPSYHPFTWRGLWDFGTGALGDMGAHFIDQPFWALELGHPTSIEASSTKFNADYYPLASLVTYQFPARGNKPPVTLKWYDGGLMPPRPADLEPGRKMGDSSGGVLYYGTKGTIMHGTYGKGVRIIPESKMKEFVPPAKTLVRSPGIYDEWITGIKENKMSSTDFSYSGKLTEVMLLGNIAVKLAEKNTILNWDPDKFMFTNLPEANEYLHYQYAPGWSLE